MRLFGFLVALMFLFTLPAQADDAKIESIGSRIADILRPRVIELDREVMTFHYAVAESDPKVTTKAEVTEWTENIATQFFNPDAVSGDLQGVGFYVATDPHASRSYGGQHPLLFAVPIIKGAKILILSSEKPWDANDVRKVKALINEAQCGSGGQNVDFSVLEDVTRVFRNSLNRDCRQIIQSAYLQLGVQAILYNYGSDSYARGCRSRSDAFNLIAKGVVNIDHAGLYWDHGSVGDRTLTRMISQSYLDAQTDFLTRYGAILFPEHLEIPGSLKNVQAFERAAYSWRNRNLFRCGPVWSLETGGNYFSILNDSLKTNFSDRELVDEILNWHRAYNAREKVQNYDPETTNRIAAVETLAYIQSGFPADMSQFVNYQHAVDDLNSYNLTATEKAQQAGALLNEVIPPNDVEPMGDAVRPLMEKIYDAHRKQPGLYGDLYKRLGLGPIASRIKLNQILAWAGAAPFIVTPVSDNANVDDKSVYQRNRTALLEILRRCSSLMDDPSVSEEKFGTGDCAVRAKSQL